MTRPRAPREDLALDSEAVLRLVSDAIRDRTGAAPATCEVELLKRTDRRLVVLYGFGLPSATIPVVGKWYGTDRAPIVADALAQLRSAGFAGAALAVPDVILCVPDAGALFTSWEQGVVLRQRLREEQASATGAGRWIAAFHGSGFRSPRSCGPDKQRRAVGRWIEAAPQLRHVAVALDGALAGRSDPELPVHYDYYHSQILTDEARTIVLDLDEAGLGDPAFDLAHFAAHLRLLALQWFDDPRAFEPAIESFRGGYAEGGGTAAPDPVMDAFAWFKLAHQCVARGRPDLEWRYAVAEADRALATV